MLTKMDIEKFYECVDKLKLRFPNAAIAKATGFSKGNVSEYMNRKKEPSEAFINAFYKAFPNGSTKDITALVSEPEAEHTNKSNLTPQIIFNLSESSREHATADRLRADAEKLREENNRKLIDLLSAANADEENRIAFQSIVAGLPELLVDLGLGMKHWKSKQEGFAAVRNKLFGNLQKKKSSGGIQTH